MKYQKITPYEDDIDGPGLVHLLLCIALLLSAFISPFSIIMNCILFILGSIGLYFLIQLYLNRELVYMRQELKRNVGEFNNAYNNYITNPSGFSEVDGIPTKTELEAIYIYITKNDL